MGVVLMTRHPVYIAGVFSVFIATILFFIGSIVPAWVMTGGVGFGLWFACDDDNERCVYYNIQHNADWVKTVNILQVIAMLFLVFSCCTAIFTECRLKPRPPSCFLESVVLIGGLIGLSGPMVYVGYTRHSVETAIARYGWAFSLNVAAACMAIVTAVVMFITNILTRSPRSPADESYLPWNDAALVPKPYPERIPVGGLSYFSGHPTPGMRPSLPDYQTSGVYSPSLVARPGGNQLGGYALYEVRQDSHQQLGVHDSWDDVNYARLSPSHLLQEGHHLGRDDFTTWDSPSTSRGYLGQMTPSSPAGDYGDVMGSPYNAYVPVYTIPRAVLRSGYHGYRNANLDDEGL